MTTNHPERAGSKQRYAVDIKLKNPRRNKSTNHGKMRTFVFSFSIDKTWSSRSDNCVTGNQYGVFKHVRPTAKD